MIKQHRNHPLAIPFIYCTVLLAVILWGQEPAAAQSRPKASEEIKASHKRKRHAADSVWKKDFIITDTSAARIITRIEEINNTLNNINDVIDKGYDTSEITDKLPEFESNIKAFGYTVATLRGSQNINNLSLMDDRLDVINDDLKGWQSSLMSYYTELVAMNAQLRATALDSTARELPADTALRFLYLRQLKELREKWVSTDSITRKNLLKIDLLQSTVTNTFIGASALQKKILDLINSYSRKAFSNEYGYLWQAPAATDEKENLGAVLSRSFRGSGRVLEDHLEAGKDLIILAIVLSVVFFVWLMLLIRKAGRLQPEILQAHPYLQPPAPASFVFLFTLVSFIDLHPPTLYLEMIQVLLILSLSLLLFRRWSRKLFVYWLVLIVLFVFYSVKNLMVSSTYSARIFTFIVDLFSVAMGWLFYKQIRKNPLIFPGYFKPINILYIVLNLAAALSNLFGRVTLSQVFGSAAISSLVQAIGLTLFIQIVMGSLGVQMETDKKNSLAITNRPHLAVRLKRILTLVAGVYWLMDLGQNLNIYDHIYDAAVDFLNAERSVGSSSFTFSGILLFIFVIWIANMLQKFLGYFLGDSGDSSLPGRKIKLGTSILLIRLVILTGGFLLAVMASGIPLDRVTIVIGALGVGIGLGLQNIVNNLVSGVILAIEKPIQVGDQIEISGNSGKVKGIGIRSSRIITADGAEIIIPNGDMLSQKLTNWTLSNNNLRVEINIRLGEGADLGKARGIIFGVMQHQDQIMPSPAPQVLFRTISQTGADVQVLFWAYDINNWVQLKSDILQQIYEACYKESIPVTG